MKIIVLLAFIVFNFFTSIWSVINYREEKRLGIEHKYGIIVFNALLWIVITVIVVQFLCSLPNETY